MEKILWDLQSVDTRDGVRLNGIVAHPKRIAERRSVVVVMPGLTSTFYGGQKRNSEMAAACTAAGFGFAVFNNRGHDIAFDLRWPIRSVAQLGGSGFERFTDCAKDIDAIILGLRTQGYRKFILAGHSTGANKVAYYLSQPKYQHGIIGAVLLAPICDIAGTRKVAGKKFDLEITRIKKLYNGRNGDQLIFSSFDPGLMSIDRFLSMYLPGQAEDMFPYHDLSQKWSRFKKITKPMLLCIGEKDEWLDRSVEDYVGAFASNLNPKSSLHASVIPKAGHLYRMQEKLLAKELLQWIQEL
jgi:pimeloyl-ACP methyl ester carboxylesterase